MLRGLATISFWAEDLDAAKQWYADLLGIDPYFERPGYFEFRLSITASIFDPFGIIDRLGDLGRVLGIMYNPHYLEVLDSAAK